jgi:hypothetical protein
LAGCGLRRPMESPINVGAGLTNADRLATLAQ